MRGFSPAQIASELEKVIYFLHHHRIPYLLIGGMALSLWGRPRTTLDLDFMIQMDEENFGNIKRLFQKEKIRLDQKWMKWNPLLKGTRLRFRTGQVSVDLMRPRDGQDRQAFRRKRRRKLGNQFCFVVSPEDFVLQKLKVGRPRDFEDALSVLERMRGKLNEAYLRRWARKLGIGGELSYVTSL